MFRVGQKVVCVDDSINPLWGPNSLVNGNIYTVARTYTSAFGPCLFITEVDSVSPAGFLQTRFRPVVERKTSIDIFTAMLKPSRVDA